MPVKRTPRTKAGKNKKVGRVMHEFKEGKLKSSSGHKVTKRSQAVAIAMGEAGIKQKARRKRSKRRR